jgi:hypothetical protein
MLTTRIKNAGRGKLRWSIRLRFYEKVVSNFIPDRNASVLVVRGGLRDKEVFERLQVRSVVISNLDPRTTATSFAPYEWSFRTRNPGPSTTTAPTT